MNHRNISIAAGLTLTVVASLVLTPSADAKPPKPPKVERKMVLVGGEQGWVDTGITLRRQDKVTLTADGEVCFHEGVAQSCVGPGGWPRNTYEEAWQEDWNICNDPSLRDAHAGLLGEVDGQTFWVGNKMSFSDRKGTLILGINDCSLKGQYGNTGQLSVVVVIERYPQPTP